MFWPIWNIQSITQSCDAIIFSVGSSDRPDKDKTMLVDHIGVIRSMVTTQVQVVKRYIKLNAINADENNTSRIDHHHKAEAFAERHLLDIDLDWTIICPGGLRDDEVNSLVSVRSDNFLEGVANRGNLAAT